jgi:hypothetical protein
VALGRDRVAGGDGDGDEYGLVVRVTVGLRALGSGVVEERR